jgi:hypothetical protein
MCALHFENNFHTIEGVRFASISKKTPLSKLSFAFVSLVLPLLVCFKGWLRVYYGPNFLLSKLSIAQSSGKFCERHNIYALIKNEIKFSSYIRKFRVEQLQSVI